MNKLIVIFAALLSLVFFSANSIAENCISNEKTVSPNEFSIHDSNGNYMGYIALENDGTWFAWTGRNGALNNSFQSMEESINAVCNLENF